MALPSSCTVLVVGSGNAGFSAAVAARQGAQDVILIDQCPESWAGGNSYFTAGAYRTVHGGKSDLLPLVNNVDEQTAEEIDIDPYTEADFYNDLSRMCGGRSDPELARILVQDSTQAIQWLASNGIRFQLSSIARPTKSTVAFDSGGPGWDCAKVRGTPYNTGDVLNLAIRDAGAATAGNWSGCHSVAWDANAPSHAGDQEITNEFTKSGYPLGLMLNTAGKRFVDEGVDLRNFTYAKFGRAILGQPDRMAFQVWDSRMIPWLRDEEYREERVERITAPSITELASKLVPLGLRDPEEFIRTLDEYNTAVTAFQRENPAAKWDPAIKDGLSTQSSRVKLALPKTNWATPLDQGPFSQCGLLAA
ncbi:unnamed protein product [Parascedosporium putredinis]|uniref:FAD-dependent oxidoreductase 2 FAD-binding domain-containing protein n=1 Tax=Parascedosporium putredinis TaxID=1442378 RepID=A0A9P1H4R0_9PEZI|nr:unnamed protein product [Parascedosporium putredinis]CAI7996842.1 unnamed protein product [Parascedosporium putredinis]